MRQKKMMSTLYLIIYLFCFVNLSLSLCTNAQDEIHKEKLGTKTGYLYALKDDSYWEDFKKEAKNCFPLKVWFLSRHGTRYPLSQDIASFEILSTISEEILYNHLQGRGCLTEEEVFEFKKWIPAYDPRDKGQLHATGAEELFGMGEHWQHLFPDIFGQLFDSSKIKVEFTTPNRTGQSAYHFLRGMYGDEAIGKIPLPQPYQPNFILRPYRACPRWMKYVYRNNETTYKERNYFRQTMQFRAMMEEISSRLGYAGVMNLEEIIAMYNECRFEMAWFLGKKSVWCIPFSSNDIKILEYHEDLKYYYECSYGTPMNKYVACSTLSDLYDHLRTKVHSSSSLPNGVLYFSHDKTILMAQTLLGLFRPAEHLRHDNFDEKRAFRTSAIVPFATNLGFALYKCGDNHKVGMFFEGNPKPVSSICPSVLCDWHHYKAFLNPIYENCDLNKVCKLHDEL